MTIMGLAALAVALGLSAAYVVPRYQLLSRTYFFLGAVLELYGETHGRMPAGFHELESAGLVRKFSYKGRQEWRIATDALPSIILFYSDDLSIAWGASVESFAVRDGHLVDVKSGRRAYIIESRRWYVRNSDSLSIRIYEALRRSRAATSCPGRMAHD